MLMSIEQVKYLFLVITEHNLRHVGIRKETTYHTKGLV